MYLIDSAWFSELNFFSLDKMLIHWLNIILDMKFNFNKYKRDTIDSLGTTYDYFSVMHYGNTAFSKNGKPTIVAKKPGVRNQS